MNGNGTLSCTPQHHLFGLHSHLHFESFQSHQLRLQCLSSVGTLHSITQHAQSRTYPLPHCQAVGGLSQDIGLQQDHSTSFHSGHDDQFSVVRVASIFEQKSVV